MRKCSFHNNEHMNRDLLLSILLNLAYLYLLLFIYIEFTCYQYAREIIKRAALLLCC